jgi:hypothetical protein
MLVAQLKEKMKYGCTDEIMSTLEVDRTGQEENERKLKRLLAALVGEYVYDPLYGYGEVVFASEKHFYVEFDGHAAEYSLENVPELKQARLRQYTAAELRELVGTIIEETACGYGESSLLVTAYNSGVDSDAEPAVMMLGEWFGVSALCAGDYSVDGHVCGVFEHLEEGDWIE